MTDFRRNRSVRFESFYGHLSKLLTTGEVMTKDGRKDGKNLKEK